MTNLYVLTVDELIAIITKQQKEIKAYKECFNKIEKVLDKVDAKENKWF